jgi:nitroreductase
MNLWEAIGLRHSTRSFKDTPVSKELLSEIIAQAIKAPSWANTQAWQFAIVGGTCLSEIKRQMQEAMQKGEKPAPNIPYQADWPEPLKKRMQENNQRLFEHLGITREDRAGRQRFTANVMNFFGAPQCIFLLRDQKLSPWSLFDLGLVAQNITLLAQSKGLGTCIAAFLAGYSGIIRSVIGIPNHLDIVVAIVIGYENEAEIINQFHSNRAPLNEVANWYGY